MLEKRHIELGIHGHPLFDFSRKTNYDWRVHCWLQFLTLKYSFVIPPFMQEYHP